MAKYIAEHGVTKCPPVGSPELIARGRIMDEKKASWLYGYHEQSNG